MLTVKRSWSSSYWIQWRNNLEFSVQPGKWNLLTLELDNLELTHFSLTGFQFQIGEVTHLFTKWIDFNCILSGSMSLQDIQAMSNLEGLGMLYL